MADCGAKTRAGTPCRRQAMPNGRCNLHGGRSTGPPKGTKNALKHGIYAKGLTGEEREIWHEVSIGSLDDELKLARIQARRALIAKRAEELAMFLRRIERMEATRAAMNERGRGAVDTNEAAKEIRAALDRLEGSVEGPADA